MNSVVIEANRRVHSALISSGEYQRSPHRGPDNVKRVGEVIARIMPPASPAHHLDVGCGDGFMFECTPGTWKRQGVDITPAMLQVCAGRHPDVKLQEAYAERLPFPDATFDVVTCYSFLDHLESTAPFYAEVLRTLKPGGHFYFGLSPNREFNLALERSMQYPLSEQLKKLDLPLERQKAFDDGAYYHENFGINPEDLRDCEPGKSVAKGLLASEELLKLKAAGFSEVGIEYEWVFQQNRIDPAAVGTLRSFLPFTSPCFKYFDLIGTK